MAPQIIRGSIRQMARRVSRCNEGIVALRARWAPSLVNVRMSGPLQSLVVNSAVVICGKGGGQGGVTSAEADGREPTE